jgi:hypothetical protein
LQNALEECVKERDICAKVASEVDADLERAMKDMGEIERSSWVEILRSSGEEVELTELIEKRRNELTVLVSGEV